MDQRLLSFIFSLAFYVGFAQTDTREWLRGQVLYRGSNVVNENVINTNTQMATITDEDGRFMIEVKTGDQLVFTAVNYQLEIITITDAILANKRLVVEVTEKITKLDEVVISPENQKRFLEVKNEKFKGFEYEIDRSTEVQNIAGTSQNDRIEGRLNFVNIFKAIFQSRNQDTGQTFELKVSEVLRQVYDDEFFVVDLSLPQQKIDAFLIYCDDKIPSQSLLKKENEFQLIDFLVTQSKKFLAEGK
ncbi:carboxypeptidase-like regulatory domain-containing protein [Muricauda sp. SCSIO 64092]|uniref:carboxypeptidase-like regulatory domain-containing protein n=1 Tax=Allomuricauda sp. SCSIO 64092 TaxID=2908842 RepID=UPI001FF26ECD|nr:carboxypeptidase-like regulatory domain-containing protein [Muricauda sp. SCSIO 64092]UOY07508.1 carboxypeptidase-like regulatory domain-containing protein [Muricauda sp. SCSIO 64092]